MNRNLLLYLNENSNPLIRDLVSSDSIVPSALENKTKANHIYLCCAINYYIKLSGGISCEFHVQVNKYAELRYCFKSWGSI